jgi:hypothetical protein
MRDPPPRERHCRFEVGPSKDKTIMAIEIRARTREVLKSP